MNVNSKAFAAPRLTKKQRKALRPDNAMVQLCKQHGKRIGEYIGRNPEYKDVNAFAVGVMPDWRKVRAGVPFVRA